MSKIPANPTKDTIYIDIDDEITSIIDKVSASPHKIVALVLPKRATTLQSIVNMKLLKRAADGGDKNLVLVTSEQGLLPLAGAVGLHVATTPQSKPYIPKKPAGTAEGDVDETAEAFSPEENAKKPIGELAGAGAVAAAAASTNDDETIQLDNEETAKATGAAAKKPKKAKAGKPKDSKLKIPNFNSFRNRLIYGGVALVVLIILFVLANIVLPKSTIVIRTDSEEIASSFDITFDKAADSIDVDENIVPSVVQQAQKTTTQTAAASGQKNNGEKARGSVTMTVCANKPSDVSDVPSGATVSSGGKNFITQTRAQFAFSNSSGGCFNFKSQPVEVVAQVGGGDYNLDGANFAVSGSNAKATGSTTGGTDNITKIVNQSDIDGAKQKLAAAVDESVRAELADNLKDKNLYVVNDSFNAGNPEVTVSAKAGDQVDSITVTQKTTYSLVGAKQSDIEELVKESVAGDIDTDKQKVLKTGLDSAVFKLQSQENNSAVTRMSLSTTVLAGPKLDDNTIKSQVAGKKLNETQELIKAYPGVTDVEVKYSPFWVSSNPKKVEKITITYEK